MSDQPDLTIPHPMMAPFGIPLTSGMVQDVWDTYVKPEQDQGHTQSGEMRCLMAILRAVNKGLVDLEAQQ